MISKLLLSICAFSLPLKGENLRISNTHKVDVIEVADGILGLADCVKSYGKNVTVGQIVESLWDYCDYVNPHECSPSSLKAICKEALLVMEENGEKVPKNFFKLIEDEIDFQSAWRWNPSRVPRDFKKRHKHEERAYEISGRSMWGCFLLVAGAAAAFTPLPGMQVVGGVMLAKGIDMIIEEISSDIKKNAEDRCRWPARDMGYEILKL